MSQHTDQSAVPEAVPTWMRPCRSLLPAMALALVLGSATLAMGQSAAAPAARKPVPPKTQSASTPTSWDAADDKASSEFTPTPIGGTRASTNAVDPLAPKPQDRPLSRTTPPNTEDFGFWRIFTALGIVLGLIVVVRMIAKYLMGPTAPGKTNKILQVVSRTTLGPRQQLMLIQVGKRLVLAAHTANNISPLCEITDPAEVTELLGSIRTEKPDSISKAFSGLFKHEEQKITAEAAKAAARDDEDASPSEMARQAKLGVRLDIRDQEVEDTYADEPDDLDDVNDSPDGSIPAAKAPKASVPGRTSAGFAPQSSPASEEVQTRLDVIEGSPATQTTLPPINPSIGAGSSGREKANANPGAAPEQQDRLKNADQTAAERAQQVAAAAMASMKNRQGIQPRPASQVPQPTADPATEAQTAEEQATTQASAVAARRRDPLDSTQEQINDLMERLRTMRSQFKS